VNRVSHLASCTPFINSNQLVASHAAFDRAAMHLGKCSSSPSATNRGMGPFRIEHVASCRNPLHVINKRLETSPNFTTASDMAHQVLASQHTSGRCLLYESQRFLAARAPPAHAAAAQRPADALRSAPALPRHRASEPRTLMPRT
jgi:hypothetical protein